MQNARWKNHKLESRLLGKINNLRYVEETTLMAQSEEELRSLLMKVKEESEKLARNWWDHDIQSHHFMANILG